MIVAQRRRKLLPGPIRSSRITRSAGQVEDRVRRGIGALSLDHSHIQADHPAAVRFTVFVHLKCATESRRTAQPAGLQVDGLVRR
jgi:hypothetical protein